MNDTIIKQYYDMFEKFERDEITSQQWYDFCSVILGEIMEEHKDVFIRLKSR
jgi:hypothetical protein